jgi:MinD-like ATPase involved in chromosome partitioning or flagellar assembly
MVDIVSVHSFRGGTGKSNLAANLAVQIATSGKRVGIVDTDVQSPGIHALFGFNERNLTHALNDFLWDRVSIEECAYPVSEQAVQDASRAYLRDLDLFLIPSSMQTNEIARILQDGYDVSRLNDGFAEMVETLNLDVLIIDTHPGLNEETLLSVAISNALLIVMRPDEQDYQGTAVTVDIARKLEVPRIRLAVNKVPSKLDVAKLRSSISTTYSVPVAGILPLSEDVALNASHHIFSMVQPDHAWSRTVRGIAQSLLD